MNPNAKIFFSYAWGDNSEIGESREKIVNELYDSLEKDNFQLIRDKYDLGYTGFITDFMQNIGMGECIVVVISKKYLRSPYCMFELYEIVRNAKFDRYNFSDKIIPIVLEHIDFTKPQVVEEFFNYWDTEMNEWEKLLKKRSRLLAIDSMKRYDRIRLVYQNFSLLVEWLIDMNTMSPMILSSNDFAAIKSAIRSKLSFAPTNSSAKTELATNSFPIKLPNIRKFLLNAINDADLNGLSMDYFPEAQRRFGDNMDKGQKINILLLYCQQNEKLKELLIAMEESNSGQFEVYKPYY